MQTRDKAVALFRPADEAALSAARLQAAGFAVVLAPVLTIVSVEASIPEGDFDALAATSARAFQATPGGLAARFAALPLFAVGAATAAAARAAGFAGESVVAPDAVSLAQAVEQRRPRRLLYLAGRFRKPELEAALARAGIAVTIHEAYAAEPVGGWNEALAREVAACASALHYSRRSAALACELAARGGIGRRFLALRHVCISADAAAPLVAAGAADVRAAARPDENSLIATLCAG